MADFESNDESKADISSLLEVNRLDYRLPPSLSIATSRAMKVYVAQQSEYVAGGSTLQFTLSSGATYVDFLNSYLKYTVRMPDTLTAAINPKMSPHTGWANMIQQVRIVHSSGVELDRMKTSVGEWIQIQNYYDRSEQCRRTQGSLYGLNDTGRPSPLINTNELCERAKEGLNMPAGGLVGVAQGDTLPSAATEAFNQITLTSEREFKVAIPLHIIMGFFNVDLLAPSFLSAGLQIYIDFYPPQHFFMCGTSLDGTPTGSDGWPAEKDVKIIKPEMHLETFTLTDSIVRKLSQISASSGLEWYFDAVHQMDGGGQQSDYSMQITRALSRANNVIVKTRNKTNIANTYYDSFGSQPWVVDPKQGGGTITFGKFAPDDLLDGTMSAFQVQLGAQYIPSRSITDQAEFVHSALKTFSQFRRSDEIGGPDGAQFAGYRTTVNSGIFPNNYSLGLAISAVPLESSSTLQQSGAAISAQRTAVVNMTWKNNQADSDGFRKVDCFVQYSKLATLFLDSVVVRS